MVTADALAAIVLSTILRWTPAAAAVPHVDYAELAADVAAAVVAEGPIWPSDTSGRRTAILLAAIAYWEGARFAAYVDNLDCNRWATTPAALRSAEARRLLAFGHCDGGNAYSLWQIHPQTWRTPGRGVLVVTGDMLADRRTAARVALVMARSSFEAFGDLSGYTGERGAADHPKARKRERFAARYW